NLFIQKNGKIKVLDFGIARMREGVKTVAGTMLGTVAFMPPEQLRGAPVDARADLYALGATMFTVISGRRVHQAPGDVQLAAQVLSKPAPSLASVAKGAPEHLGWVVDRALAYLVERRYPDARTMRGDVWALQKNQRPPYAYACDQSGLDPHVTELDRPTRRDAPPARRASRPPAPSSRPSERPASMATTAPQMPAFLDERARALPSTEPQMPAFLAPAIESAEASPESDTANSEAPDSIPESEIPVSIEIEMESAGE